MKTLFISSFLLCSSFISPIFSQTKEIVTYYNDNYVVQPNSQNYAYKTVVQIEGKNGDDGLYIRIYARGGQIIQKYGYKSSDDLIHRDTSFTWYTSGKRKSITVYDKEGMNAYSCSWYETDTLKSEDFYAGGKLNGTSTDYYENGQVSYISVFRYGKSIDTSTTYFEDGNLKTQTIYGDPGKKISHSAWNPDGSLNREVTFDAEGDTLSFKKYNEIEFESPDTTKKVYDFVEQVPEFPGGFREMANFLQQNIKYPHDASENGMEGTVYVRFIVDDSGTISELEIARGVYPSIDFEALRVVKAMPAWTPGMQNGKPVKVRYTIPIKFQLS